MVRKVPTVLAVLAVLAACAHNPKPVTPPPVPPPAPTPAQPAPAAPVVNTGSPPSIVPMPATVEWRSGDGFRITAKTVLRASNPGAAKTAAIIGEYVRRGTGLSLTATLPAEAAPENAIEVVLDPLLASLGKEGYELTIEPALARLRAGSGEGLFYGAQTLRQLLPYWSEYEALLFRQPRPATLPAVRIQDAPRYEWRGAMLDVARHFFTVDEVKRFIDLLAFHKMNRLHLHLADDQGWRIEIAKWPDLTIKGGLSEVGGTPGGFYTKAQYADLVAYAGDRFITVIPEIDMPGHTNAALASYAELNCSGQAPPPFTGTAVGFSALCVEMDFTYRFIDDIVGEIAAMTPGPYFHVGGDEVKTLSPAQYKTFVERVQAIVQKHGKRMIGWDEVAATSLLPSSIVQHWRPDAAKAELARAPFLIMSPGNRTYLDMKYDRDTALGLNWAGLIPLKTAYDWDPSTLVPGAGADAILGVEAPLWSETLASIRDAEFLAMPRLAAIAEVAWSPGAARDWEHFRVRLAQQGPRWTAMGINFYRSPEIAWK